MKKNYKRNSLFSRLAITSLVSVYVLILVGGIVRSTGSGMGCPDWPKCFGKWVPPTEVAQLPPDYKEIYSEKRAEKNQKFSRYLAMLGFTNLADQIRNDQSILEEADFNSTKTWTEYINRLVGVLVGLFIFAMFVSSMGYFKSDRKIFSFSLFTLLLVGFQGWIGSIVVSTRLMPWMITIHMFLALVLVCCLTYLVVRSKKTNTIQDVGVPAAYPSKINMMLVTAFLLTLVQIILGTQVRESVNRVAEAFDNNNRSEWISQLGYVFPVHRSFSLVILALNGYLVYAIRRWVGNQNNILWWTTVVLAILVLEILSGAILNYFGIPRFVQPVHLLLATLIFGIQFLVILKAMPTTKKVVLAYT